jgi:hypothetical protein
MEQIQVKFYRVTKYTDPTGMFRVEIELGLVGLEIMGKFTTECKGFPKVSTMMGPFDPKGLEELQDELRKEEKKGEIKNLTFEEEIIGVGVRIKIDSEKVQMN